jgi:hypothetical protein
MKSLKTLVIILSCLNFSAYSQNNFFTKNTSKVLPSVGDNSEPQVLKSVLYNLDITNLKYFLKNVGNRDSRSNKTISIPYHDGSLKEYQIFEASVMEAEFQSKYPNMRSYAGQGITNPEETIRFTVTSLGFSAIILGTPNGTQMIEPVDTSINLYTSYFTNDIEFKDNLFECEHIDLDSSKNNNEEREVPSKNADDGILRNYRFALSATSEYSAFYGNNLEDVISSLLIATANVNAVLERDLSVRLTMIDNTDLIFFDPENDPFTNDDNIALLGENQTLIDNFIGDENYDIGHVINTAGGGVAALQSSCVENFKAYGVTGATSATDARFIFVFLHELGHQFGSPHTFNGSVGPCETNISPTTALEPGSGTTIMAYPGLCSGQNVINSASGDLYYHQISLSTMWSHILNSGSCPIDQTITGNTAPVADAGADYLIPQGTPYKLTGSSTDIDGTNTHTYTWEQYDFGPAGAPTETTLTGPLVRSFEGTMNPVRYIPNLSDLLDSPGSQTWERLVTVERDINFRLTVRDNDVLGGQTAVDAMTASVTTEAGPFEVTSQTEENAIVWVPGSTETITWNVAGTDANGINESTVNILLSTDAGLTYDTVLVENTPNDGIENIQIPDVDAAKCRIMIEAVNNIFFNINEAYFAVGNYTYEEVCDDFIVDFNTTIPENPNNYVPFTFEVDDILEIEDLDFNVNISGAEDNGSIIFAFSPPFGGFYELGVYPCPGTSGFNLTFDDEGNPIDCENLNAGDNVLPVNPLSVVDGENANGEWTFWITDINDNGVTSNLNSITLGICYTGAIPTLSTQDSVFEEFNMYPNPSNGTFNLSFNSLLDDQINIEVLDLNGRKLKHFKYEGKSTFFESIDVSDMSSGVYIVRVIQQNTSISKKLIVRR